MFRSAHPWLARANKTVRILVTRFPAIKGGAKEDGRGLCICVDRSALQGAERWALPEWSSA